MKGQEKNDFLNKKNGEVLSKLRFRGFCATSFVYDFSTLYTTLSYDL